MSGANSSAASGRGKHDMHATMQVHVAYTVRYRQYIRRILKVAMSLFRSCPTCGNELVHIRKLICTHCGHMFRKKKDLVFSSAHGNMIPCISTSRSFMFIFVLLIFSAIN